MLKSKLQPNGALNIDGAILTPDVVKCLGDLQYEDNYTLKNYDQYLADAVCYLLFSGRQLNEDEYQEASTIATNLAYMRKDIFKLRVEKTEEKED